MPGQVGLGGRDRGKGEEERGREGGKRRGVGQSASPDTEANKEKTRRRQHKQREKGRGGELLRMRIGRQGERQKVRGGMSVSSRLRWEGRSEGGRGMWRPIESEIEKSLHWKNLLLVLVLQTNALRYFAFTVINYLTVNSFAETLFLPINTVHFQGFVKLCAAVTCVPTIP